MNKVINIIIAILLFISLFASILYTIDYQLLCSKICGYDIVKNIKDIKDILINKILLKKITKYNALPLSRETFNIVQYLPFNHKINIYRYILMKLKYLNLFNYICYSYNSSCAIIYKNNSMKIDKYLVISYINDTGSIVNIDDLKITFLPKMSPVSLKSNICLVFKKYNNITNQFTLALSLIKVNYTQVYYLDLGSLRRCKILIPTDEKILSTIRKIDNNILNHKIVIIIQYNKSINYKEIINELNGSLMHRLSQISDIYKDYIKIYSIVFKNLYATGTIFLKPLTGSTIIQKDNNIIIINSDDILIKSLKLTIGTRLGFYSNLSLSNATLIIEKPTRAIVISDGCVRPTLLNTGVKYLGNVWVLLRGFKIKINGKIKINNIFTFKDYYNLYMFLNENIQVNGYLMTKLIIFDNYIAGTDLLIKGNIKRQLHLGSSYNIDIHFIKYVLIPSLIAVIASYIGQWLYKERFKA